jgi:hypothetical protein
MTKIVQRRIVACPYNLAKGYLDREFQGDVPGLSWRLRVSADVVKDVDVQVRRAEDPMHFDEPWTVTWVPHGGGPYPSFKGTLTVRADEDWTGSELELSGSYDPPFGAAGKAFDLLLGERLATATAKTLLDEIGSRFEAHYRRDEAAKISGA